MKLMTSYHSRFENLTIHDNSINKYHNKSCHKMISLVSGDSDKLAVSCACNLFRESGQSGTKMNPQDRTPTLSFGVFTAFGTEVSELNAEPLSACPL